MKKFSSLISLSVCIAATSVCLEASAQEFTDGNFKFRVIDEVSKTCELTGVVTPEERYEIPGLADGYTVVQSAGKAFQGDETVKYIKFPPRFQTIGNYCFADCKNLETVVFPRALVNIGNYTFSGCTSLQNFELPAELQVIGARAFLECNSLTEITIPKNTVSLGAAPFPSCANLKAIYVEEGNEVYRSVDGVLYKGKGSLVQVPAAMTEFEIPQTVDFVMIGAFWGCSKMTGPLIIPETVTAIGSQAFYHSGFTGEVVLPRKLASVYTSVFEGCEGITSVVMPGVTYVSNNAFTGCTNLRSMEFGQTDFEGNFNAAALEGLSDVPDVILGSSVTKVVGSFRNIVKAIPGIKNLTIGANVDTIAARAFSTIDPESVLCLAVNPPVLYEDSFTGATLENATLTVPESSIIPYATSQFWRFFNNYDLFKPEDFTAGNFRFSVIDGEAMTCELTGVVEPAEAYVIPGSPFGYTVVRVPEGVFEDDLTVTSVTLPSRIRAIGDNCFRGCSNLATVEIPYYLESLGAQAFFGCDALTEVNLPASLSIIGEAAFASCSELTDINVSTDNKYYRSAEGVLYKGYDTVMQVPAGKTEYTFPEEVLNVQPRAFWGCSKITGQLELPAGLTSLGASAFHGAGFTGDVVLPEGLGLLPESVFEDCSGITAMVMPGVSRIESDAFAGCTGLRSVEFGMTDFGDNFSFEAFSGLTDVNTVIISENVEDVSEAFRNVAAAVPGFRNLTLGAKVETIGAGVFADVDLETVRCESTVPPAAYETTFSDATYSGAELIVPDTALADYTAADVWKNFKKISTFVTDNSVTAPGADARVVGTEWYDLSGAPVQAPAVGNVYVRISVMSDGSRRVEKICQ